MGYNKVTLHSNQTCNYLYVSEDAVVTDDMYTRVSEEPVWDGETSLLATFHDDNEDMVDSRLLAGDPNLASSLVGCEIRRKKNSDPYTEYVATIDSKQNGYIIDYSVVNNAYYIYYLYPQIIDAVTQEVRALKPLVTEQVKTSWYYWCLMTVEETERDNVFFLSDMFFFRYNLENGAMSNNANISLSKNFTKYPSVQHGDSNYWSSTLSGLVGGVTCPGNKYYQTNEMINSLKALTTDGKRKFLKDIDGNIFEVAITDSITIENTSTQDIKRKSISWAEVGDAKGVSIIGKPSTEATVWLLTDDGITKPYLNYALIDNGTLDVNKFLTGNKE